MQMGNVLVWVPPEADPDNEDLGEAVYLGDGPGGTVRG